MIMVNFYHDVWQCGGVIKCMTLEDALLVAKFNCINGMQVWITK